MEKERFKCNTGKKDGLPRLLSVRKNCHLDICEKKEFFHKEK